MRHYHFHLITNKTDVLTDEQLFELSDLLYEAGCDDGTVAVMNGTLYVSFDRESDSYEDAVISALNDVEKIDSLRVVSVDAGEWVGLTDAAILSGITKSTLSRYSKGNRGSGGFPSPKRKIDSKNPLWKWSEIAAWLNAHGKASEELAKNAEFTETINASLQMRNVTFYKNAKELLGKLHHAS